jgi:hypothetical protein
MEPQVEEGEYYEEEYLTEDDDYDDYAAAEGGGECQMEAAAEVEEVEEVAPQAPAAKAGAAAAVTPRQKPRKQPAAQIRRISAPGMIKGASLIQRVRKVNPGQALARGGVPKQGPSAISSRKRKVAMMVNQGRKQIRQQTGVKLLPAAAAPPPRPVAATEKPKRQLSAAQLENLRKGREKRAQQLKALKEEKASMKKSGIVKIQQPRPHHQQMQQQQQQQWARGGSHMGYYH